VKDLFSSPTQQSLCVQACVCGSRSVSLRVRPARSATTASAHYIPAPTCSGHLIAAVQSKIMAPLQCAPLSHSQALGRGRDGLHWLFGNVRNQAHWLSCLNEDYSQHKPPDHSKIESPCWRGTHPHGVQELLLLLSQALLALGLGSLQQA